MNIINSVDALLNAKTTISDLENESILTLRAIGYQLASRYKFSKDKDDTTSKAVLATLISIRKLVKSKMGVEDLLIKRFESEQAL